MRRLAITAFVTVVWLLAAAPAVAGGGGHGTASGDCAGFSEGDGVGLRDNCIDGGAHFLPEGENLLVVNEGLQAHNYVAVDESFGTARLETGEEAVIESPDPGVYRVWCQLHASEDGDGMAGVLVVGEPDDAADAASPGGGMGAAGDSVLASGRATAGGTHWPTLATAGAALLVGAAALLGMGRQRR